ncbi:hypothetical protein C4M98_04995, partial [Mycoplasmopsis pullorum]
SFLFFKKGIFAINVFIFLLSLIVTILSLLKKVTYLLSIKINKKLIVLTMSMIYYGKVSTLMINFMP